MRALRLPALLLAAAAIASAFLAPGPAMSAQGTLPESFTAFAINMNSGPSTATVDIKIERWSTDEERQRLLSILVETKDVYRANEKMLDVLQRMPKVGYIREPTRLAWDLKYARQNPLEGGGRQIVIGTDRPVGFWEARNQPRTMDYPFTILELRLNQKNEGEGKLLLGTKLYIDKKSKNVVLENYGQQPVRLNNIRPLK